jgi:hypothetical protein
LSLPGTQRVGQAAHHVSVGGKQQTPSDFFLLHKLEVFVYRVAFCFVFGMLLSLSRCCCPRCSGAFRGPASLVQSFANSQSSLEPASSSVSSAGLTWQLGCTVAKALSLTQEGVVFQCCCQPCAFNRGDSPLLRAVTQVAPVSGRWA